VECADSGDFREKIVGEIYEETLDKIGYLIIDGKCSVTKTGATIFYAMQNTMGKSCIWMELEDFSHPNHLLSEIFRTISIRFGLYQTESINVEFPSEENGNYLKKKIQILVRHYGIEPRSWCLFIYGRNVAGSCAGYREVTAAQIDTDGDWKKSEFERLRSVLGLLTESGFKVIYMPFSQLKAQSQDGVELNPAVSSLLQRDDVQKLFAAASSYATTDGQFEQVAAKVTITVQDRPDFGLKNTIENLVFYYLNDANDEVIKDRLRLIYSATLFRQSRHVSALFSESAFRSRGRYDRFVNNHPARRTSDINGPHDLEKHEITEQAKILSEKKIRFFNTKPGGSAWMFRDVRLLANALTDHEPGSEEKQSSSRASKRPKKDQKQQRDMRRLRTRMHFWIGQWYMRAFYSSNHVDPLKEAIFHTMMAIKYVQFARLDNQTREYRETLLVAGLATLAKIIMISRDSLRFWTAEHRSAKIFYWRAIKKGMEISFSVSELMANTEKSSVLRDYIKDRIDPPEKYAPTLAYEKQIAELMFDIRNECFKLERDILRYSNYHSGMHDAKKDSEAVVVLPFSGVAAKMIVAEIEPFIAYEPGKKWHKVYDENFECFSGAVGDAIRELRDMAKNYLNSNDCSPENRIRDISSGIRTFKHKYSIKFLENSQNLNIFVQMAAEFVYRLIRQAKFENRCLCIKKQTMEPKLIQVEDFVDSGKVEFEGNLTELQSRVDRYWQLVGLISQALLELSQQLPSSYLLQESELKAKLLTFSGLSLGRLGKFLDAHQTLNEATGIAYNMPMYDNRREVVILRLRRAEVHLLEAIKLSQRLFHCSRKIPRDTCNSDPDFGRLLRLHIAKLDDAWTLLEEVESLMPNCMHSALWCGKLYYIRLMIFAECYIMDRDQGRIKNIPRVMCNLENSAVFLLKTIELGVLSCGDDAYRKLCFLNVFVKAAKKYKKLLENIEPTLCAKFWNNFRLQAQENFSKFTFGGLENDPPFRCGVSWVDVLPYGQHGGNPTFVEDDQLGELISGVVKNFDIVLPLGDFT